MKEKIKNFRFTRKAFAYPYMLFLLVFVVTPLVLILANAFIYDGKFSFKNFAIFFTEKSSLVVLGNSILVGLLTTIICIVLGYPAAYFLAKYSASKIFVLLFILPMWVNFLIRTLATKAIFVSMNIPLGMGTVVFGMVYNYLPFMILPIYTAMTKIDDSIIEAAQDLGCNVWHILFRVLVPLTGPGIATGITQVFVPAVSTFIISRMLGGGSNLLIGDLIELQFLGNSYNLNLGSAMSLVLMVIVLLCMSFTSSFDESEMEGVM